MYGFDEGREFDLESFDQESAVFEALEKVDKGLFDVPEEKDEDLEALFEKAS